MTTDANKSEGMVVPALPYGAKFVQASNGLWDIRTDSHWWNGHMWGTRVLVTDKCGVFTDIWSAAAEVPCLTPPPGWVEPKPEPEPASKYRRVPRPTHAVQCCKGGILMYPGSAEECEHMVRIMNVGGLVVYEVVELERPWEKQPEPAPPVVITHGMRHKDHPVGVYDRVGSLEALEALRKRFGSPDAHIIEPITCWCGGRGRKP